MTSLADTKHIFIERFMAHWILHLAKTTRGSRAARAFRARQDYKLSLRENKPTKTRQNWHCFLTCFLPALLYRCLHPGLTSDLTSFSPLTNFTSSGTFALRKFLSLVFFKKESDVWRTSAPFFDRSSHIDNFKVARTYLHARWLCFCMAFFGRNNLTDFHDFYHP